MGADIMIRALKRILGAYIMIGLTVEFQVERGVFLVGVVTAFDEDTGKMEVRDECGDHWCGYEYQAMVLDN